MDFTTRKIESAEVRGIEVSLGESGSFGIIATAMVFLESSSSDGKEGPHLGVSVGVDLPRDVSLVDAEDAVFKAAIALVRRVAAETDEALIALLVANRGV